MSSDVTVVIPYRSDGSRERETASTLVGAWYEHFLPGAQIFYFDSDPSRPFNRSAARNAGVRDTVLAGDRVVVVSDADTYCEPEGLLEAIEAAEDGRLHIPYRDVIFHDRLGRSTRAVGSQGGVFVMDPAEWLSVGGMNETLEGWGFEDPIFHVVVRNLIGLPTYHDGTIHHLWHPVTWSNTDPDYQRNLAICREYERADGDIESVWALVERDSAL